MSAPRTAAEVQEWKCGCRPPCSQRLDYGGPLMSACRCLTQQPLPHEGHCCLKDGWNPAADQLPDMHPDLIVCSHSAEWAALHQVGGE